MTESIEEEVEHLEKFESLEAVKKPKKVLTEKQKEQGRINLAKGRANLAIKKQQQREDAEVKTNELVLLKAEKLKADNLKRVDKIKKLIKMDDDEEVEIEERIIKKPKKKKIIYREESDSEEEVVIKRKPVDKTIEKNFPAPVETPKLKPKQAIIFC